MRLHLAPEHRPFTREEKELMQFLALDALVAIGVTVAVYVVAQFL